MVYTNVTYIDMKMAAEIVAVTKYHELIIPRKLWVHGGNKSTSARQNEFGHSSLLNEQGKMCCLGHLAKSCGLTDRQIKGKHDPSYLSNTAIKKISNTAFSYLFKFGKINSICSRLIEANDAVDGIQYKYFKSFYVKITQKERESKIRNLMLDIGVRVKFVD